MSERYAKGSEPWLSRAGHDAPTSVKTVDRQQKRLAERRGNKDMWRVLRRERLDGHRFQRMLKINTRRLARSAEP